MTRTLKTEPERPFSFALPGNIIPVFWRYLPRREVVPRLFLRINLVPTKGIVPLLFLARRVLLAPSRHIDDMSRRCLTPLALIATTPPNIWVVSNLFVFLNSIIVANLELIFDANPGRKNRYKHDQKLRP
jgi:hypothetical protein